MPTRATMMIVLSLLGGMPAWAQELAHPPVGPPPPPRATEFNRLLLRHIEDDAPVRNERENRDEALAFDAAVSFARRVSEQSFRESARRDLALVHLLGTEAKNYRGDIIEVRGTLLRNLDVGPTPALRADGVAHLFEAYLRSEADPSQGWCVFHTEKSPQLPVGERLDKPVVCRGYFFKVYAYREHGQLYRMPLLIGRGIELSDVAQPPANAVEQAMMSLPVLLAALAAVVAGIVGLFCWYQVADRRTRQRIQRARSAHSTLPDPADSHGDYPSDLTRFAERGER